MSPFQVRAPRPADLPRMAELAAQLGYPAVVPELAARLQGMQNSEQYFFRVGETPEIGVAGWIGAHIVRTLELDPFAEISGLVVEEAVRSQGLGQRLLEAAEAWARQQGFSGLSVRSNITRLRAHRFYERNGYHWTKTQHWLHKAL